MKMNVKVKSHNNPNILRTHEGAIASRISAEKALRRSVMSCMLWESEFYEDGVEISDRIAELVERVPAATVSAIAIEARGPMKLRHVPLVLAREMARNGHNVEDTLAEVIQRPDELAEFMSLYWQAGRIPIAASVKRGLAKAFRKFEGWQLAKYDREGTVRLRDVMFLTHPKPKDEQQAADWLALANGKLLPPDTWEVRISAAKTKEERKEIWTDLMSRHRLGALALLRNLRNMEQDGVRLEVVQEAILRMDVSRVLPFRFIAAARHAPKLEADLERAMMKSLATMERLRGTTTIVIDNSGSMDAPLSKRSDLTRRDAAGALAILLREICEDMAILAFSDRPALVPNRHGMALAEAIAKATVQGSTNTEDALRVARKGGADRIIVVTDEQSHQTIGGPGGAKGYFINVASARNGIGYGQWTHIDGFSESVIRFIQELEKEEK